VSRPGRKADSGKQWIAEVKQHFSGQVVVAKDLMEF
jgi:hypothetical protein